MAYTKNYSGDWKDLPDGTTPITQDKLDNYEVGIFQAHGEVTQFEDSDLVAGVLTITHSLGEKFVHVSIWNASGVEQAPDVTCVNTTTVTVDLSPFTVTDDPNFWTHRVSL